MRLSSRCSDFFPPRTFPQAVAAAILALAAATAQATVPASEFSLPTGRNPQSLSANDCDGNGTPDLVAANFGSDTVTVHLNPWSGDAATTLTLPVTPSPAGAACADFTGDGLFDVAVASFTEETVTVYRGEEDGSFTDIGSFAAGVGARTVSVMDFEGNGVLDLAVVNSLSDDVSILIGDGTGAFPLSAVLKITGVNQMNPPVAGAVADYNQDGAADVAVVSQGQPSLHVLLAGSGVSTSPVPTLPRSRGLAAADLNDDGFPDLAALSTESVVRILLGGPDGFTVGESAAVLPNARAVALADFDQDGLIDMAIAYNDTNTIQLVPGLGPGQFPTVAAVALPAANPLGPLAVRSTAGTNQVLLLDEGARSVLLLEPAPDGGLGTSPLHATVSAPTALRLADVTGDGTLDAVVVGTVGRRQVGLEILPGVAPSGFAPAATGPAICGDDILEGPELCDDGNLKSRDGCGKTCQPEINRGVRSLDAADMTGDGVLDLVIVDARGQILLLVGDGTARFPEQRALGKVRSKTTAVVADFDGNGTPDVAFLPRRRQEGALAVLFNDGLGGFTHVATVPAGRLRGPIVGTDVDGDGTMDVVVQTLARPKGLTAVLNDGAGPSRFGPVREMPRGMVALVAADLVEDGRMDLLVEFTSRRQLPLMVRGLGGGAFAAGTPAATARFRDAMVFDVDNDLHKDIVVCDGGALGPCRALYGDGTGHFTDDPAAPDDRIGSDLRAFAAAHLDDEPVPGGVVDLVGVSRDDGRVVVLCRRASDGAVTRAELSPGSQPIAVAVGELTGDARADILVANEGTHDISFFRNLGGCAFSGGVRFGTGGVKPRDLALAELNGVPPLDAVVGLDTLTAGVPGSGVAFLQNVGNGTLARSAGFPTDDNPQAIAVGHLNADAQPDVVAASLAGDTLTVLRSAPGGGWTSETIPSGGDGPSDVLVTDVDGDMVADVVAVHEGSAAIAVLANDGTGALAAPASTVLEGRVRPWNLCAGDFDLDGAADVAVASLDTGDVLLLRGDGAGSWLPDARTYPVGRDPRPVECRDLDGDGRTDVLFARRQTGRVDAILSAE